jgi:hypothetical protein
MVRRPFRHLACLWLAFAVESACAVEFEPLNTAIAKALGTTKAVRTKVKLTRQEVEVYYPKDENPPERYAVVYHATYPPNCAHTWVIGLGPTARVREIRVVEMACPHAFAARNDSFLEQYIGKGPAQVATLKSKVQVVAKATGSSDLTTQAVKKAIVAVSRLQGD